MEHGELSPPASWIVRFIALIYVNDRFADAIFFVESGDFRSFSTNANPHSRIWQRDDSRSVLPNDVHVIFPNVTQHAQWAMLPILYSRIATIGELGMSPAGLVLQQLHIPPYAAGDLP